MVARRWRMLNPQRDADLLSLGATTDGVVSLDVCRAAGLSDRRLSDLVATGRWQSPWPRVYVTFSGPLPSAARLQAAVRYAGRDATISHASAGYLWRLTAAPPIIHLTHAASRRLPSRLHAASHDRRAHGARSAGRSADRDSSARAGGRRDPWPPHDTRELAHRPRRTPTYAVANRDSGRAARSSRRRPVGAGATGRRNQTPAWIASWRPSGQTAGRRHAVPRRRQRGVAAACGARRSTRPRPSAGDLARHAPRQPQRAVGLSTPAIRLG
jgi:hypothetical protein